MLVYKNGVYYMDSLQEAVDAQGDGNENESDEIYISIPEDKWDEFANDFSVQVYNNKTDYKKSSDILLIYRTPLVFYTPLPPCSKPDHIQARTLVFF